MYTQAARDYVNTLSPDDMEYIAKTVLEVEGVDRVRLDIYAARDVRNRLGLWDCHPLTESWRRGDKILNEDGFDMTPNHPDNVSALIWLEVLKILGCADRP